MGANKNKKMPSGGHTFSQVPRAEIPRSSFDRSHGHKTTFDAGGLIPFFYDEALPGDTFNLRTSGFARMATPIFPIMDNLHMETFYFSVPIRLIWENFQRMMGEQDGPNDSTDYLVPWCEVTAANLPGGYTTGTLGDYFGLPTQVTGYNHSALWYRAYQLIFQDWFRDQNLKPDVSPPTNDGPDLPALTYNLPPFKRGKRHDYFTSCLPWPQKGPEIEIPLGLRANVLGIGKQTGGFPEVNAQYREADGTLATYAESVRIEAGLLADNIFGVEANPDNPTFPNIYADLSNATSATINQLRQSFQVQKMYERDARGGSRYTEIVRSHFGVTSPDARLQRPEYLGGGHAPVNISPIHSTADTRNDVQQGSELATLSAVGTASFNGHGFTKSFTEHCILIGLVNVRADLTYQQGLNRMWSRRDRLDFFWPALSHIGEQEVLNKEIYVDSNDGLNNDVFGYQERFAEYRYKPNQITGQFRSNDPLTLDAWHLAQEFATRPTLSGAFIDDNPPNGPGYSRD